MAKKSKIVGQISRKGPDKAEADRLKDIRRKVAEEFPPVRSKPLKPSSLAAQIQAARKARGLSWYAVAKQAGIPNPNTVRDIELGRDVLVSNLQSVARVLKLKLGFTSSLKIEPRVDGQRRGNSSARYSTKGKVR